jgi:HK97 family phage prohead protease
MTTKSSKAIERDFSMFSGLLKTALEKRDDGGDDMVLTGVASSTIKDRHGDTITQRGLESMLKTAEGMTIYLNHSYDVPEDVAGTVRAAWIDQASDDLYDLRFKIGINQDNPRAIQAWNAIDKGTKLGLSIGAMIPDGGAKRVKSSGAYIIDEVELLETSIVSIPANPRSWVDYARKSLVTKSNVPEVETADEEPAEPIVKEDDPEVAAEPPVVETYAVEPELVFATEHFPECNDKCDPATNTHYMDNISEGGEPLPPIEPLTPEMAGLTASIDEVDAEKNKVTVWPSGKVAIDTDPATPPSQAPSEAEPGTEESDADALSAALGEMAQSLDPELQKLLGPTFMATLQTSHSITVALLDAVEKADERVRTVESERDQAWEAVKALQETTEAFITRVAAYPRGRRAIAREIPATAKAIEGIRDSGLFADDFMAILEKGATPS